MTMMIFAASPHLFTIQAAVVFPSSFIPTHLFTLLFLRCLCDNSKFEK